MVTGGEWVRDDDNVVRPYLWAHTIQPDGQAVREGFLVDSGADCSQFSYRFVARLGIDLTSVQTRHAVVGVGGQSQVILIDKRLVFETTDGGTITVNGPFFGSTEPDELDVSILGRDVLGNFDVIISRRRNEVLLLVGNHAYAITG